MQIQVWKTILIFMTLIFVLSGSGCADDRKISDTSDMTSSNPMEVTVKGSDTVRPLSLAASKAFMAENPDITVSVIGGGSGAGFAALVNGEVEIAMASRQIKDSEYAVARSSAVDPVEHIIARDGICVVVNKQNPVSELTFTQLGGIFNGTINNWNEVGGKDLGIVATTRDTSSGTYEFFKGAVLKGEDYREDALLTPSNTAVREMVADDPGSIGYIGIAYLDDSVKALAFDMDEGMVSPEEENILSGKYPLARPLFYYTNGHPTGLEMEFIEFVQSESGKQIISDVGYFPA